jgi:hypothetical protein
MTWRPAASVVDAIARDMTDVNAEMMKKIGDGMRAKITFGG